MLHNEIMELVDKNHFSDLLIKEGSPVWARQHGVLTCVGTRRVSREQMLEFIKRHEASTGVVASKVTASLEEKGDLDFAMRAADKGFRGNLYWSNGRRLTLALRALENKVPALETLGLPQAYLPLLLQSKGLLLVTGSTGSGKTTTLAASLEHLNQTRGGHIVTLEDPVEYTLQSKKCLIDQRQIGRDVKSFSLGLRAALRQDPDIILVGELRDYDTVKTALDAANTGHLVLGTLHTNSAQQSIERLTSFFSADKRDWAHATLSQALLGIVSQVLMPRRDGNGRALAAELLVCTPDVKSLIREGRSHQIFNVMDTGSSKGHVLLNHVLRDLVRRQIVTDDEAVYRAYDPARLRKELGHA